MANSTLKDNLKKFDFDIDSSASGLLFTGKNYKGDEHVSFSEVLVLDQAEELGASAVYFRRIEGRVSVPQLFIFENIDEESISDIHRKIWSGGIVPLYYVFDDVQVRIFNSRKPLESQKGKLCVDPLHNVFFANAIHADYQKYSANYFENGSFWELPDNKDQFGVRNSSYQKLIEGLVGIRDKFSQNQNEAICNKLLVLSMLVKYLEEKKDSEGVRILPKSYFNTFNGASDFCDVLRKGKCHVLFKDLSEEVNGGIFKLTTDEEKKIRRVDQPALADFLDAKKDGPQLVFWPLYDFNYLPVELISRIYEEFVPTRKDISYTPAHLVNFMIDECMPVDSPPPNIALKDIKLIDVSCGSGIFLVAAFKRLVQWWQKEEYDRTGDIVSPDIKTLKFILKRSIFGVDIESEAVKLAKFSLTIALCDMLNPVKMWEELTKYKLLNLKDNFFSKDFFDFIKTKDKFHYIVGNPPFNPPKKGKVEKERYWNEIERKADFEFDIPGNNIALAFLQKAMTLLEKGGVLSLVMPSAPLLYNKTLSYRSAFFEKYNVPQIIDFTCLRAVLFEKRNISVSVIFARNEKPNNSDMLHMIVRRTRTSKERHYFEVDKYDLHYVPKEIAQTEPFVWKANLLGGGHLYYFIKRIQAIGTLREYLKEKKKRGWKYGTGYFVSESEDDTGKRKPAKHLTGKDWIPTDKFNNDKINSEDIVTEKERLFEGRRERNKEIFLSPHILIKTNIKLPVCLYQKDLIFRRDITGIHAPANKIELEELSRLEKNIKRYRPIYKALFMIQSGKVGITRATVIKQEDILNLPYPENKQKLQLSDAEEIVLKDVREYGFEQVSKGETAKVNTHNVNKSELRSFGDVFCKSLSSIYSEGVKKFYPLEPIESSAYICYPFAYGNPDKPKTVSQKTRKDVEKGNLDDLIDNPRGSVLYKRIITLYGKDRVYLIKPKLLKYWLKSIALRDANDVFADLVSSEY